MRKILGKLTALPTKYFLSGVILIILTVGLILSLYLLKNPLIFKSSASVNILEALELQDGNGESINCYFENGKYRCPQVGTTLRVRVKDFRFLEDEGGKGCQGDSCYYPIQSKRVPLDIMYNSDEKDSDSILADCQGSCRYPEYRIRYVYNQKDISVPEFESSEVAQCLKEGADSIGSSSCGPSSLAMVAEAFNGEDISGGHQTANNLTRLFLANNLMTCKVGTKSENLLEYARVLRQADGTLQVRVLDKVNGEFAQLEKWYRETGYPVWTGVYYRDGDNPPSPHYATIAAVTDTYVWLADPYQPEGQTVIRIEKDIFKEKFYRGNFWKIAPLSGKGDIGVCPSDKEIENNKKSRNSCHPLEPNIDIFNSYIEYDKVLRFIEKYAPKGKMDDFANKTWYIVKKSREAGLNPAVFLGYWKTESGFSTIKGARDLGCSAEAVNFQEQVDCALGIGEFSDPAKNPIANCARSYSEDSVACKALKALRNTRHTDQANPIAYPIRSFDDFVESYGPLSPGFSKQAEDNNNCIHTYNALIQVAKELGVCGK